MQIAQGGYANRTRGLCKSHKGVMQITQGVM